MRSTSSRARFENKTQTVNKGLRVHPDLQDRLARQDRPGQADLLDHQDLAAHQDPREHRDLPGRQDLQDRQDLLDLPAVEVEVLVRRDHRARPALRGLKDLRVPREPQGLRDHMVQPARTQPCKDRRDLQGNRVIRARPDLRAIQAQWGRQAIREHKDLQVLEVIPAHVGLQDLKARPETKEIKALKDHQVHQLTCGSSTAVFLRRLPERSSTLRTIWERTR